MVRATSGQGLATVEMEVVTPRLLQVGDVEPDTECQYRCGPLQVGDSIITCPACETATHTDCWEENLNSCPRDGCGFEGTVEGRNSPLLQDQAPEGNARRRRPAPRRRRPPPPPVRPAPIPVRPAPYPLVPIAPSYPIEPEPRSCFVTLLLLPFKILWFVVRLAVGLLILYLGIVAIAVVIELLQEGG